MHLHQIGVFLLLLLTFSAACLAGPYTSVIVYGDSLSDNGNFFKVIGQPGVPYSNGRSSNGDLAVEDLAKQLGVPLVDVAWIGATTGLGNHMDGGDPTTMLKLPGMETAFLGSQAAIAPMAPTSLFVIWGGPDDFLSPAPADGGDPVKIANRAVDDLKSIVTGAQALGAQHILVPGMPDLGLTPYFQSLGQGASGTVLTNYFNAKLAAELAPLGAIYVDTASLMRDMIMNPTKYGFTNVTDACFNRSTVCRDADAYLFFDDFHPTAHANVFVADKFAAALVPEPATYVLVASGLALAAFTRARTVRRRPDRHPHT